MRYLCLVHFEPLALGAKSPAEKAEIDRRSLAYDRQLAESGHLVAAQALQPPDAAMLVRVRNGAMSATDGPFTETKEQLAGFILVEARDLNEAVRLASGIPLAELGTIEVRPIYDIPTPS